MLLLASAALAEEPTPAPAPAPEPCPYHDLEHVQVDSLYMTIDGRSYRLRFDWGEIAANLRLCGRDEAADVLTEWQQRPIRGPGGAYRVMAALGIE